MRAHPNVRVERFRISEADPDDPRSGCFRLPSRSPGQMLQVIASTGLGWDHVSVSLTTRTPTYEEMELVRSMFFRDDETVMQLSVARSAHINIHAHCLHLWRPQHEPIPLPPAECV